MSRDKRRFQPVQFGKYTLLNRIGSGGMAEIFRSKMYGAHGFEKELAIKKILPNLTDDDEFISMFVDEAKIMVGLVHHNIVQVFDLGEIDGNYFIGMEFVHGKDLLDLLARCAEQQLKLPLKLALFIMQEILKGLDYAHKAIDPYGQPLGLIHRDVSPSNALISYTGDVKIGDFGVAKASIQRTQTEAGTLKGKVGYMSPEQVQGSKIDHRSDIFSAGIIFFEILNMRRLFSGGTDLDVMLRVRDVDVEKELSQGVDLPEDLYSILAKALSRDPNKRYQHAIDFHADLMDFTYHHRIRVTQSDLSRFISQAFKKEVEADEEQRRNYRRPPQAPASDHPRAAPNPATTPPPAPNPVPLQLRYRDQDGNVFGPMGPNTLVNVLSNIPSEQVEWVAQGADPWKKLQDFPDIHQRVQIAQNRRQQIQATSTPAEPALPMRSRPRVARPMSRAPLSMSRSPTSRRAALGPPPGRTLSSSKIEVTKPVSGLMGDLEETSISNILQRLWRERSNGRLSVQQSQITKVIFFKQGNPTQIQSNNDTELLGNLLVREGVVTGTQLKRALQRSKRFGGRLGDALVADRVILSHVLYQYLFRQAKMKILDIFTWKKSTFEYHPQKDPSSAGFPLGLETIELIVEGVRHYTPLDIIHKFFKKIPYIVFRREQSSTLHIDTLRLSARELRIVSFLDGHTIAEVLQMSRTSRIKNEELLRISFLMIQLGIFTVQN